MHLRRTFLKLLAVLTCLCTTQVIADSTPISPTHFSEKMSSNVPVSGRVLVGVALASSASVSFSFLLPPKPDIDQFCFRVISQDGTYSSENIYPATNINNKIFVDASYPSKYLNELIAFKPNELALLATPGNCQNSITDRILLTARGNANADELVTIFVSSGRSDVYLRVPTESHRKKTLKCQRIEEGARTAYDTICTMSLSQLNIGTNEISLVRRKSGRTLPTISFEIMTSNK